MGAVQFCPRHRWRFVFAAEVKFVVSQYMSSVIAERVRVSCTDRAALKPWICLLKREKHGLSIFLFRFLLSQCHGSDSCLTSRFAVLILDFLISLKFVGTLNKLYMFLKANGNTS